MIQTNLHIDIDKLAIEKLINNSIDFIECLIDKNPYRFKLNNKNVILNISYSKKLNKVVKHYFLATEDRGFHLRLCQNIYSAEESYFNNGDINLEQFNDYKLDYICSYMITHLGESKYIECEFLDEFIFSCYEKIIYKRKLLNNIK